MRHRPTPCHRRTVLTIAALLPVVAIAGCSDIIPGTGQPPQLYVLTRKTTFPPDLPTVDQQLLVATPIATAEIDTARIALSRSPTTIDYFANAAWGDRAPLMIQSLLIESFETTGKVVGISRDEAGVRADYLLMPELRRFVAVYKGNAAPTVQCRLLVRLVRMPERTIVGETVAERQEPAPRNDMEAIVNAYDDALGGVMKDLVTWTLTRMSQDVRANPGTLRPRT